jgi:hypothetical protein
MSNYTPIVNYGAKDSLAHGDTLKAIKGGQLDAELQAIASSIASKLDSAGPGQVSIARAKTTLTSKTSSTTLALDPHLQYNVPSSGIYTFEFWFCLTAGGGGITVATPFSGTIDSTISYASRNGTLALAPFNGTTSLVGSTFASTSANGGDYVLVRGVLSATSAGTFGLQWCQNSSSASPLTMSSGYLLMTKVS